LPPDHKGQSGPYPTVTSLKVPLRVDCRPPAPETVVGTLPRLACVRSWVGARQLSISTSCLERRSRRTVSPSIWLSLLNAVRPLWTRKIAPWDVWCASRHHQRHYGSSLK
jgi:hypothetical protein